jgi:hypothetical protein
MHDENRGSVCIVIMWEMFICLDLRLLLAPFFFSACKMLLLQRLRQVIRPLKEIRGFPYQPW